ncbi:MAG: Trm112 family protein [Ilumatobacteraceae bacterium]
MSLDAALLAILACPEDKGPLYFVESEDVLFNPRLRRTYPVRDGIPVMLIEESTTLDDEGAARMSSVVDRDGISPTFEI